MKNIIFLFLSLNQFLFGAYLLFNVNGSNVYCQQKYTASAIGFTVPTSTGPKYLGVWNSMNWYANGGTYDALGECSFGCATGTVFNNQFMKCVPICTSPLILDSTGTTCITNPDLDTDGDGIPDKCDFDFANYLTSDCDSDGLPNNSDGDTDGDGILNSLDPDDNGDGTADYLQPSNPAYDTSCRGVNSTTATNLPFPFRDYSFYSDITPDRCSSLVFDNSKIDSTVSLVDINHPRCEKPYCYVHYVVDKCNFDASWYSPGIGWDFVSGKTESQCNLLVDGTKYSTSSYITPDTLKCPTTGFCYLKRIDSSPLPADKNSEDGDESMKAPDLNSTTADLSPLLNAQNTTNKHLDDLKNKTDISNKHLDDLKKTANDSLNSQKDMKSVLDNLKNNSDKSLSNDLDSITKLGSLDSNLKKMSDVTTSNQMIANGALNSIDDKMTINNQLLTDSGGILQELLDFFKSDANSTTDDGTLDFISSQFGSILNKYTVNLGGGGCGAISTVSTVIHGRSIVFLDQETINKLPISDMRAVIIFLFTIGGLILAFRGN